uniref:SOCS box domain-containing protein n=1 Tax=Periophthalmus magnuspinnatus TaxID=409849 RepID=A0A3B4ARI2_9GOBI
MYEEEPIFQAIRVGDAARVKALALKPGTNLMLPSKPGWLPIHQAAWYGQTACLKALISGRQPGMLNKRAAHGESALLVAVQRDNLDCALILLENGADPDSMNSDKETPLYKACERCNPAMVATLLNAAVNLHCIQGWTALQEAVVRNSVEICEMLISAGAKINIPNMYGISPMFTAAQTGSMDALCFLIKHGLYCVHFIYNLYYLKSIRHFPVGADINTQAADGNTALYEAAKNRHEEVTSKARVRRCGISPLHLAAERNRDEVLEMLLEAGYDPNMMLSEERSNLYEDRRRTALYFSVANVNVYAIRLLLSHGAATDLDTLPPLMVAARQGAVQSVTLLLEHGADVNVIVPSLTTSFPPLIMFCSRDPPLLKLLLDHGLKATPCFICSYGDKPHPSLSSQSEDRTRTMEFCEMVSSPTVSRWVGPIVDLLLDYVGHVSLCSRLVDHLDSYSEWSRIKDKAVPPRPLMHLCRLRIRCLVPKRRLKRLPLPPPLLRFLQHEIHEDPDPDELEFPEYSDFTHQLYI